MVISHDFNLINNSKNRIINIINGKLNSDTGKKETKKILDEEKKEEDMPKSKEERKEVEKKDIKLSEEFDDLSKSVKEKLKKFAIKTPQTLLNITEGDLKNMDLKSKERGELENFVRAYLKKQ